MEEKKRLEEEAIKRIQEMLGKDTQAGVLLITPQHTDCLRDKTCV